MWRSLIAAAALSSSAACASLHDDSPLARVDQASTECLAAGGSPVRVSHFVVDCAISASDAGRPCVDTDECEGLCELPESMIEDSKGVRVLRLRSSNDEQIVGACSDHKGSSKLLNCAIHLRSGHVVVESCIG